MGDPALWPYMEIVPTLSFFVTYYIRNVGTAGLFADYNTDGYVGTHELSSGDGTRVLNGAQASEQGNVITVGLQQMSK